MCNNTLNSAGKGYGFPVLTIRKKKNKVYTLLIAKTVWVIFRGTN